MARRSRQAQASAGYRPGAALATLLATLTIPESAGAALNFGDVNQIQGPTSGGFDATLPLGK